MESDSTPATRAPRNTRRHRRVTLRILVDYQAHGRIHCDYATTLGAGGMFLGTELSLERGDPITVRFRIPGGQMLHEITGHVTWSHAARADLWNATQSSGVGLQFDDPEATARLARELEDYAAAV